MSAIASTMITEFVVAYITAPVDLAPILASKLVASRMAACVNLVHNGVPCMPARQARIILKKKKKKKITCSVVCAPPSDVSVRVGGEDGAVQ
jgi:hypothetical protein